MNLSETYNLKVLYPEIAKQWHPLKNGNLTPDKVTPGSKKKIWWVCHKGHEWQTTINKRRRGDRCPYCSGRRASKEYNLSARQPELTKQWHPNKNGNLTPDKVTPGSQKKVWWLCDKGHEWQAIIKDRVRSGGCPYCSGRGTSRKSYPPGLHLELAKQWHPVKNGNLTPDKVTPGSGKKVWWLCDKGHEWQAVIASRNRNKRQCPYCSGKRASKEYNLSVCWPELAKQWHPVKNGDLTPDKVTPGTGKKLWWVCDKGHEWQTCVSTRIAGCGCPYCSGVRTTKKNNLSTLRPELAKQWHPFKNGNLTPDKVTPGSGKKVWWKCVSGHEWQERISKVSKIKHNPPCPFCSGKRVSKENNLLAVNPGLARQWHPVKNGNLTPGKVMKCASRKVWWICDKGHEWKAKILSRSFGTGCPKCESIVPSKEHNLMISHPDISDQWHPIKNGSLTPEDVTPRSIKKVWWMCHKGHEWEDIIRARTKYGNACPYCYGIDGCKEYNLAALHPNIARQWHQGKNGKLTPQDVTPGSKKKVWWVCDKGHEWQATIHGRVRARNCPYCRGKHLSADYNLKVRNPQLASQWHPIKNKWLKPTMVTPASRKKVWWKCDKGHEWLAIIGDRSTGTQCPYCSHKRASSEYNLVTVNPDIARQWHPTKNRDLTPEKVTPNSGKKVWWKCDKGHEWLAVISNRNTGTGCPYCAGRKK